MEDGSLERSLERSLIAHCNEFVCIIMHARHLTVSRMIFIAHDLYSLSADLESAGP